MSIELNGAQALSDFLSWLSREVLRGTIVRCRVRTVGGVGRALIDIEFNTTCVQLPPALTDAS